MKKRMYRATDIRNLSIDELAEKVRDKDVIMPIDVAKEDFVCALMSETEEIIVTLKWKHPFGSEEIVKLMTEVLPVKSLEVIMEPSGTYQDAIRYLFESKNIPVYRANPKRVHDAAEVFDGVPSLHDAKAAMIIGRFHMMGLSQRWEFPEEYKRTLETHIKTMWMYDDQLHRNINRLEAYLSRFWPEINYFLDSMSVTFLELISQYGCPAEVVKNEDDAVNLMHQMSRGALSKEKIDRVIESSYHSVGMPCIEAERQYLMMLASECRRNQKLSNQTKKCIDAMTKDNCAVQALSKITGKITSAVLVCEVGDPNDYNNARSYVKSLGLGLKERSSGRHKGKLKITKRGSNHARQYLYLLILRLIKTDPIVSAWYENKIKRDAGVKLKAITALMRKVASALWYVAQGEVFDSRKLFDCRKLGIQS